MKQTHDVHIDGLNGNETNPFSPSDPNSLLVPVSDDATYDMELDPGHHIWDCFEQMYGTKDRVKEDVPTNNGFVVNTESLYPTQGSLVMKCFNSTTVPVLSTLASEYAVFDRWYSSVPGPTQINRMFLHSTTSQGYIEQAISDIIGISAKTIYEKLEESKLTWSVYYEEATTVFLFKNMRKPKYVDSFSTMSTFEKHAREGKLAHYSYIEPSFFNTVKSKSNDQHPGHSVLEGEKLISKIYETLRNSPSWNDTLFLVTYDEHGGFYDHVIPPSDAPNPDHMCSVRPPFDFSTLGFRVPTIAISPWIQKSTVVHEPIDSNSHYEHSSIAATLHKIFNMSNSHLTKRDQWAATFDTILFQRKEPRTDCLKRLPILLEEEGDNENKPLNGLQKEMMQLVSSLNGMKEDWKSIENEHEGAEFTSKHFQNYLERLKYES